MNIGNDMTRVLFTRGVDGRCLLEIIVYSSSPHYDDATSYVELSAETMKELAEWITQP